MKLTEFEQHYNKLKDRIDNLMVHKAGEYADDTDRLANFKQTTSLLNTNELKVAVSYWLKHVGSIVKIADDIDKGVYPTPELLEEKCGDLVAYAYLMYACGLEIIEKHEKELTNTETDHILLPLVDKYKDPYYLGKEFDNNDSITKCPRVTVEEALETLPLDREEQKDLEQVVAAKNQLDNLNLRTNL